MPIDPLRSFLHLLPPGIVDALDAQFETRRIASDVYSENGSGVRRRGESRGRSNLNLISSRHTDPRRGTYEELAEHLHAMVAEEGRLPAMRALAPYLAPLTVDMLNGNKRAASALMQLYAHETAWTPLVHAVFHSSEALGTLSQTKSVNDFGRTLQRMYRDLLERVPSLLLEREEEVLAPRRAAEIMAAWACGPFETVRFLFDYKFSHSTSQTVRAVRGEDLLPILKSVEHMASGVPTVELLAMAKPYYRHDLRSRNLRKVVMDSVMSLSDNLCQAGICPRIMVPAELEIISGCPVKELSMVLVELLINARKFRDRKKPHNAISIVWDGQQHAIAVRDNGIGIANVNDVWPDKLYGSNAFGSGVAMQGSLFQVRKRLKDLTWRMTLASEPGMWTEFTIYPRLGDIADARREQQIQPASGPPLYGNESEAAAAIAANAGPVSVDASTRLYSSAAIAQVANLFPLTGLLK